MESNATWVAVAETPGVIHGVTQVKAKYKRKQGREAAISKPVINKQLMLLIAENLLCGGRNERV